MLAVGGVRGFVRRTASASPCLRAPEAAVRRAPHGRSAAASRVGSRVVRKPAPLQALTDMATEDTVASSQEPLLMPLDFYELLRVEHSAEPEECWQAYQRLVAQQPDAEYSQEALFARANILRQGADRLMDRDARTAYNLALAESAQVEVCQPDLPGALALIQESGRSQDVLRIGVPWLQQHGQVQAAQDVALSLALAYCDVAGEELSKSKSVSPSCDMLHEALVTLRRHGSAPRLQADIKGALDELVLQYVQEQLQMAPGQPRHARAVQLLGTLLWGQSQAGEPIHHVHNTHAVLASVRPLLSSEDVCTLASQRPPATTVTDAEAYDHALALLAEGVRLRLPQRVHCAQSALAALRDASRQAQEDGAPAPDVQAELVTCAVLLGDADAALGILGIDASSPPDSRENRAAAEASPLARFVLGTSASASDRGDADLLPGLCLLVDRWIAEVLNQSFRQVPSSSAVSLADWGADRQVQLFLRMRDCAPSWELVEAVDRAGRALAGGCSCVADGCVSVLAVVLAGARLLAPGGASAGLGPLLPQWLSTQPDAQPHRYNAAASPAAASGPVGTPPTDSTAGSASGRPRATAADAMDIGIELDSQRLEMLMKENTTVGEMRKRRRQLMDIKQNVAEAQSSDELQVRVSRVLMYDYGQGSSYLASTVETSGELRPQSSYARSWSPEETAAEEAEAPGGGPLRGGRSTSRSVELGDGAGGAADEASLWMKGGCGEYDEDELGDTGTFQVGRRQQIDLAEQERRMWERRAAHPWELKPVPFKSVVFLMATLLFAIAGTRTYYRIYDAARWGRMGVSGDQASMTMDVEMALGVMESWQEAKAAAMGESHQIGALGRVLEGSMLQQWQQRARETLRRGWHWRYTLVKSEIDNIEVSDNNSWAAVQATFTESAQMLEGSELRDSYSSTYSIQYRLVHRRDGWKIMESSIVR